MLSALLASFVSCSKSAPPNTLTMIIEFSPANLDPRVGTDAQSERIDELLFDSLVRKDEHFTIKPWLAESWEIPDPQTYIFHLRHGVQFHDGSPLTAKDVKWTLDSVRNGTVITLKSAAFKLVDRVETTDDYTVVLHLKEPDAPLMWSLTDGALGIVPYGSDKNFNRSLIGSGPFKFVRFDPDSQVIIERNNAYWADHAKVERVRFVIVPDATTRALELRKGSADVSASNSLPLDVVRTLRQDRKLEVMQEPGTNLLYVAFNLRDPVLKNVQVRQAIAYAINREPMLHYLFADAGRLADSVLPPQHWAYNGNVEHYPYNQEKANMLLEAAGYPRGKDGVRFHITMKTSTEETSRLIAVVMQQQLREVGVAVEIRSFEPTTFYADVVKGAFQMYTLRWLGYSNEDPDIFEYAFYTASFAPKAANRSYYSNARVDQLIEEGRRTLDQERRKAIYSEVQTILAHDLPYIDFWYLDNVLVHSTRVRIPHIGPGGNYDFLTTAELTR